ncbi:MAG: alpha/beta fold hydrolase [Spirosomataceae bacterium]
MKKTFYIPFGWIFLLSFFAFSCQKNSQVRPRVIKPEITHFIEHADTRLHFVSLGNPYAPPILFIHGAPGNWKAYNTLLQDSVLRSRFHIISVDRLGYGKSRKRKQKVVTSIVQQADAIVEALHVNLSGEKALIIGRSYGAAIAAEIGIRYAEKAKKVFMISPVIDPDKEKYFWFAHAAKHWLVRQFLSFDLIAATDEKFAHERELRKIQEDWDKLTVPTTVFMGGQDWIADLGNFQFAKKRLKKDVNKFIYIPDAGHMIAETHPQVVLSEILNTPLINP